MEEYKFIAERIRVDHPAALTVHHDAAAMLRVGINHLVTARDSLRLGDVVSLEQVEYFFKLDFEECIKRCFNYSIIFYAFTPEMQKNVAALVYLTAGPRIWLKDLFTKIENKDYSGAIEILEKSVWNHRDTNPIVQRVISTLKKGGVYVGEN
jgi:hypothetical protein